MWGNLEHLKKHMNAMVCFGCQIISQVRLEIWSDIIVYRNEAVGISSSPSSTWVLGGLCVEGEMGLRHELTMHHLCPRSQGLGRLTLIKQSFSHRMTISYIM
jgi:hypothetical protein